MARDAGIHRGYRVTMHGSLPPREPLAADVVDPFQTAADSRGHLVETAQGELVRYAWSVIAQGPVMRTGERGTVTKSWQPDALCNEAGVPLPA